jgi:hypothetical protein
LLAFARRSVLAGFWHFKFASDKEVYNWRAAAVSRRSKKIQILKAPQQKPELDREIRRVRRLQCVIDQRE